MQVLNTGTVGIVLVSHSLRLAEGTADIIRGLAGYVELATVGGTADALGAMPGQILQALEGMRAAGVLVFTDIGSSTIATGAALDLADADLKSRVWIVNCPFVEGVLLAGVCAMDRGTVAECLAAAETEGPQLAAAKVFDI